jgi:hypothetical protein
VTGMSPTSNSGTRWLEPRGGPLCRVAIVALVLNCGSWAVGQELSAFPETSRPLRRIDTAAPVQLADAASATTIPGGAVSLLPASVEVTGSKTPIRRLAEAGEVAGTRSQATVWVVLIGIVAAAGGLSLWARRGPGATHWKIPSNVFQVLGRSAVNGNQSVTLLRLGERVLLVSSSGAGMQTLAVVTDPAEVAAITSECLSKRTAQLARISPTGTTRPAETEVGPRVVAGGIGVEGRISRTARRTVREFDNA